MARRKSGEPSPSRRRGRRPTGQTIQDSRTLPAIFDQGAEPGASATRGGGAGPGLVESAGGRGPRAPFPAFPR
eukprot:9046704-Pyramimonas_sp.AAC.1